MLKVPASFPHPGCLALVIDPTGAVGTVAPGGRAELVRVIRHEGTRSLVAFPLRDGATGNKLVAFDQLLDGTELTPIEKREMADLQRNVAGRRIRKGSALARDADRADALNRRHILSAVMAMELRKLDARAARDRRRAGESNGSLMGVAA